MDLMSPEVNYPIETSSNKVRSEGLRDPNADPWRSAKSDHNPAATISLGDEDSLVTDVFVSDTKNVASITVIILNKDGQEVM